MQFKGTKKRNAFEISDAFDRIGAQVNAYTGKDTTVYYTKSTSDHAATAFEVLADLFLNATYPEEEIAREKGVICEEISMNEDTPEDLALDLLASSMYGKGNYGRNILGPAKNVKSFTLEDVKGYKDAWYRPENIVISFAGAIDFETAQALVENTFGGLEGGKFQKKEKKINFEFKKLKKKKPIEQTHLAIGYRALSRDHELFDAMQAACGILGGNMSSRLFQEVREKRGLAYSVYSFSVLHLKIFGFTSNTPPKSMPSVAKRQRKDSVPLKRHTRRKKTTKTNSFLPKSLSQSVAKSLKPLCRKAILT
jgi:predicted Zn-dependent peptidase